MYLFEFTVVGGLLPGNLFHYVFAAFRCIFDELQALEIYIYPQNMSKYSIKFDLQKGLT